MMLDTQNAKTKKPCYLHPKSIRTTDKRYIFKWQWQSTSFFGLLRSSVIWQPPIFLNTSYWFCLIHSTPATLAFLMFLERAKHVSASETRHFLFPLSGRFFLQTCQWLALYFCFCSPVTLQEGSSGHSTWNSPVVSPPTLFPALVSSMAHIMYAWNSTNSFIIRLPH